VGMAVDGDACIPLDGHYSYQLHHTGGKERGRDVCCCVLQCVAVCCSLLPSVAVCFSPLQSVAIRRSLSQSVAVCCSLLQFVAVCCSLLQSVAVCCSLLQYFFDMSIECTHIHIQSLNAYTYKWKDVCVHMHKIVV